MIELAADILYVSSKSKYVAMGTGASLISDPVGPDNNAFLRAAGASGDLLVAAWGGNAKSRRVQEVLRLPGFERINYLRLTQAGQPSHPLYLPKDLTPTPWPR
ncbi:DUF1643 domain-containing protein [Jonesiaceae bacterium BS-20]|uniref:DUF1643 domain-containing protein n=1 Tax=Jonesiaceae bacterium BS-20 TaxID=3120821 RepID=A0AAU7DSZ7_9MICO